MGTPPSYETQLIKFSTSSYEAKLIKSSTNILKYGYYINECVQAIDKYI